MMRKQQAPSSCFAVDIDLYIYDNQHSLFVTNMSGQSAFSHVMWWDVTPLEILQPTMKDRIYHRI
jgi:hypothetical protein